MVVRLLKCQHIIFSSKVNAVVYGIDRKREQAGHLLYNLCCLIDDLFAIAILCWISSVYYIRDFYLYTAAIPTTFVSQCYILDYLLFPENELIWKKQDTTYKTQSCTYIIFHRNTFNISTSLSSVRRWC